MMSTLYPLDWSNARFFAGRPAAYRHVTTGDWDVPAAKILALGAHEIAAVNPKREPPATEAAADAAVDSADGVGAFAVGVGWLR